MEQEILAILKSMEKSMQTIHDNLDKMHTDIKTIKNDTTEIQNNVANIDKSIAKIKERQDTLCIASSTILDKIQATSSLQTLEEIVKQNSYDIACLKAKNKNS